MPVGAIAAVGGALIQGSAAKKAARAQTAAANQDMAFQRETRDLIRSDLSPYRTGGYTAQQALDFELGLADRPMVGGTPMAIETIMPTGGQTVGQFGGATGGVSGAIRTLGLGRSDSDPSSADFRALRDQMRAGQAAGAAGPMFRVGGQTFGTMEEAQAFANANTTGGRAYGGFTKTPGYDFRLQQGQDSLEATAAARGGLYSGAAMRDALKFGQDYGSNEYGNYLARLGARADTGLNAATMSGNASQQAAAGVSNALGNIGNAQSAGAIGMGNAFTGGIQNALGAWNYQRNLSAGMGGQAVGMFGGGR